LLIQQINATWNAVALALDGFDLQTKFFQFIELFPNRGATHPENLGKVLPGNELP
jgi:hypothetical protein